MYEAMHFLQFFWYSWFHELMRILLRGLPIVCALALPVVSQATTYYLITGHTNANTQVDEGKVTSFYAPSIGPYQGTNFDGKDLLLSYFDAAFNWELGGGIFTLKENGANQPIC